jgi:ribosomal protein S25
VGGGGYIKEVKVRKELQSQRKKKKKITSGLGSDVARRAPVGHTLI